jgi:hypothetical protein
MAGLVLYAKREGSSILPVNAAGEEELRKVREGQTVRVNIVKERSAKKNGFFWQLCKRVADAMQAMGRDDMTKDIVADQLKIATGHCRAALLPYRLRHEGQMYGLVPKSIDFHTMDDLQFSEWLNKAVGFICMELLPHIPAGEQRDDILKLLDPEERRRYREARGGGQ